jgi:small subunit ribosomal protein S15
MTPQENKKTTIDSYKSHEHDTGSTEVQIALLTNRINELNKHFVTNKKDHSSKRGLMKLVGSRRSLLTYLKRKSEQQYKALIERLGIRR